jgi:hypothetical protein
MILMNYFLSNLFRDKVMWGVVGLSALAGLLIMDILTYMFMPRPVFNLWTVKITVGAAVVGAIIYGIFLYKHEDKEKNLAALLPDFLTERQVFLETKAVADPEFQTLCHKCRYFDLGCLRCLLVLRERKAWIRLNDDSPIRYCLYWNLDDRHPVMLLTGRLKADGVATIDAAGSRDQEEKKGD